MIQGIGYTYSGFDKVEQPYMDPDEVVQYAHSGYSLIRSKHDFNDVIMVSALFIPHIGVFVGSKPRAEWDKEKDVAAALLDKATREFPLWNKAVEGRDNSSPEAKLIDHFHSEDQVLIDGGAAYCKSRGLTASSCGKLVGFSKGTWIATWGAYKARNKPAGLRPPCSGGSLSVPCSFVLEKLRVSVSIPLLSQD